MSSDFPHSGPGVAATIIAVLLGLAFCFVFAVVSLDPDGIYAPLAALLVGAVALGSATGVVLAFVGLFQGQRRKEFSVLGLALNGFLFLCVGATFVLGLLTEASR